ncbi:MAG: glycerol-3-phosphate acyltransferase [Rickettsiales bacterium]|jgi:glycerol-3-phosphate acyltransferase PlsY|nr:glycerol-3-phosphate acyltransferase [Rickettsiales bacterium]
MIQLYDVDWLSLVGSGSAFLLAFLMGGIPFGYLIVRLVRGTDIREQGSGNIGATNVWRLLGGGYGLLTFILDGSKSLIPLVIVRRISGGSPDQIAFALSLTVAGHIFSPWLGWRGGKGFSSFILGLVALDIRLFLVAGALWLAAFYLFRIAGLATLLAVMATLLGSYFVLDTTGLVVLAITCAMIIWAHRKNIEDLISPKG